MFEWFECKIKYEKNQEDGSIKKVSEPYLVDAVSFTDAEKRIIEEIQPFMTGEFEVSDIKRARYAELFETHEESADRFFKAKLTFITLDEKTAKEKKTSSTVLIQATDLRKAIERLDEGMKSSMMDYTISAISETMLMDVFHYQEEAPEGMKRIEKTEE